MFRRVNHKLYFVDKGIVVYIPKNATWYSPFGELLTQPTHDTPFLFNGQYGVMTDANDLYYMRARFYSPDLRRFINQDILLGGIENGQSLNRYAYVMGDPIKYNDPFGLTRYCGK
ncbi:RHS repeat-associated core domain-containing protein, partial [Candidatus Albibeggiatoa sp. nov. BB20]|uniref:RHS repeat-associated core domain-containing protein n=1 Tax=Candidatus Albibeggiatoa sp. nov. BB20 TaxID=3162723 RepID=UPI0033654231